MSNMSNNKSEIIDIQDGIIRTSNNEFFAKEDVCKVDFNIAAIKNKRYTLMSLNTIPKQKVYIKTGVFDDYDLIPENLDLEITQEQYRSTQKDLKKNFLNMPTELCKTVMYRFYNDKFEVIGSHNYSITTDTRDKLIALWELEKEAINNLPFELLGNTKNSETIVKD